MPPSRAIIQTRKGITFDTVILSKTDTLPPDRLSHEVQVKSNPIKKGRRGIFQQTIREYKFASQREQGILIYCSA